jgi:hypothetical protein
MLLFLFLKNMSPPKYMGTINHNLARKYLNETHGISEVIDVISIQARLKKIAIVIGCLIIRRSIPPSRSIFSMKIRRNPIRRGSVGTRMFIPILVSPMSIAKGVTRTASINTLSRLKIYMINIMQAIGMNTPRYISLYTR